MKLWKIIPSVWNFLNRITPFEWVRVIKDRKEQDDYLIRYYIVSTRWIFEPLADYIHPWFNRFSYRVTLHNTLRSDEDGLHDHPWAWGSRILQGGYYEDEPDGRFWRGTGSWRWRRADQLHRLVLPEPKRIAKKPTWSLFIMGPKTSKQWGFLNSNGDWVHHREYLADRASDGMA